MESKVVRAGADLMNREWPCPNFWPHHNSSCTAPSEQISHLRKIFNEYTLVLVLLQTENSAEKANRWALIQKGYGVFVFSTPSPRHTQQRTWRMMCNPLDEGHLLF